MINKIQKFVSGCPHFSDMPIRINHLDNKIGSISLENNGQVRVIREYTDGGRLCSTGFVLALRGADTRSAAINLRPFELLESFALWLENESRAGNLPESAPGFVPLSVTVSGMPALKSASDLTARYQIGFELVYCENNL